MKELQRLSPEQFQTLIKDCTVIERDHEGDKVLHLQDGSFLKIFRVKSMVSSAWLRPYSIRFARNAEEIKRRGMTTVDIISCYRINSYKETAVHYRPLPGKNLRQVLPTLDPEGVQALVKQLAGYYHELHERGIYFRSLHLGNILQLPDGSLGLIDIADMRFSRQALDETVRLRNLKHLARYERDVHYLIQDNTFCSTYAKLAGIKESNVEQVIRGVG